MFQCKNVRWGTFLAYLKRISKLAADLIETDVTSPDQKLVLTAICSLPQHFGHLIVSIDAVAEDDELTVDLRESKLVEEVQSMNNHTADSKEHVYVLLSPRTRNRRIHSIPLCPYCNKLFHFETARWTKHPYLKPKDKKYLVWKKEVRPSVKVMIPNALQPQLLLFMARTSLWWSGLRYSAQGLQFFFKFETVRAFGVEIDDL